ncbi:primosomal protein N' [Streptococcus halichoeri]|uniref:primosomal protein N' n=1 Tax=Streptococcus halichoeri TaxID=254785 RepID=UPI00135C49D0|nr:primosomal protein N' [Streptococcus halichoeri]
MTRVADIIVDIPLMQTDRPYTYLVPDHLLDMVAIGSRVHVPFGKGDRLLQGFVIAVHCTKVPSQLKSIVAVLDAKPVLNQEQLDLATEMRHKVFSYKISLLKAMLPNVLNSHYDKLLSPTQELKPADHELIFGQGDQALFSQLSQDQQARALALVKQGQLSLSYLATDKKTLKTRKIYQVDLAVLEALSISTRAKKKEGLRQFLLANPQQAPLADLYQIYSRELVRYFIDQAALVITTEQVNRSDSYFDTIEQTQALPLNTEQAKALAAITAAIGTTAKPFLLEGITGSGKTEVYLQVIEAVLRMGKTAIVLVPEISLTPQMTQRFIARFGKLVAIMHSGLSDGEKYDEWQKIKSGQAKVVVGARSAIFAPLENIGAIIIDEEHEASYKQESNPRYHARDVALLRAKRHQAALVLGSATPSIESRARASKERYQLLRLSQRANPAARVPQVQIIDFRDYIGQNQTSTFTPYLLEQIKTRLAQQEQVVLLLNRRGYSSFIMCRNCGYVDDCPNCDISLTLHMDTKTMNCHYCGFQKPIPKLCPNCHSQSIRYYGTGTQKAYEELSALLPLARILRMDVDTTRKKGSHEKLLSAFGRHEADILLGTQMIAKGLDFPNVTLVGVLNADTSLNLPDFRASEKTFQLLTQVAGRAGRADKPGQVLIQTYNPNHYAIQLAKQQDYEAFYAYEMKIRQMMAYPPYYYTVGITLSHSDVAFVTKKAYAVLSQLKAALSDKAKLLGPTPKPIARTHNMHHYQIIIKYRFEDQLEAVLNQLLDWHQLVENRPLRLSIDHEPQQLM